MGNIGGEWEVTPHIIRWGKVPGQSAPSLLREGGAFGQALQKDKNQLTWRALSRHVRADRGRTQPGQKIYVDVYMGASPHTPILMSELIV